MSHGRGFHFDRSDLLLELRADHELLRQVFRVLNHRGHDQPGPVLRQSEAVEEFLHDRTLAVGHAVRTQIARGEVRGHDFERAAARGAAATEDAAILRLPEPPRLGMPLKGSRAGRTRPSEMEAAGLGSRVGLHHERGIALPSDAQPTGLTNQSWRPERLAQLAAGAIRVQVPGVCDLPSGRIQRHARGVALRRRHHSPTPVLGDHRDPLPGEIDERALARVADRTAAALSHCRL